MKEFAYVVKILSKKKHILLYFLIGLKFKKLESAMILLMLK